MIELLRQVQDEPGIEVGISLELPHGGTGGQELEDVTPPVFVLPELELEHHIGIEFPRLRFHASHGNLPGVIHSLDVLWDLLDRVALPPGLRHATVTHVVDAAPEDKADWRVARLDAREEALPRQVREEWHVAVVAPCPSLVPAWACLDSGAVGVELGSVIG